MRGRSKQGDVESDMVVVRGKSSGASDALDLVRGWENAGGKVKVSGVHDEGR